MNEKNKYLKVGNLISGVVIGSLITLIVIMILLGRPDSTALRKINEMDKLIKQEFLYDYDQNIAIEGMLKGYVSTLNDDYAEYYTVEEFKELKEKESGNFKGIGVIIDITNESEYITISDIFEGSPAYNAGIKAGDQIIEVEGQKIFMDDYEKFISDIQNKSEGEKVNLLILHKGETEPVNLEIMISNLIIPTVKAYMKEDNIGVIKIGSFEDNTYDEFVDGYDTLIDQGMEKMIVDLRNNPGGSLDSVVDILNEIFDDKLLVYMENKSGAREDIYADNGKHIDIPIAVLVNGNSASASEVFTGAIKDYNRGKIIGERTFGKGIVQGIYSLFDNSSLKITISNYYTPNGVNIHGKGIDPDIVIEQDANEDNVLQEGVNTLK